MYVRLLSDPRETTHYQSPRRTLLDPKKATVWNQRDHCLIPDRSLPHPISPVLTFTRHNSLIHYTVFHSSTVCTVLYNSFFSHCTVSFTQGLLSVQRVHTAVICPLPRFALALKVPKREIFDGVFLHKSSLTRP